MNRHGPPIETIEYGICTSSVHEWEELSTGDFGLHSVSFARVFGVATRRFHCRDLTCGKTVTASNLRCASRRPSGRLWRNPITMEPVSFR